MAGFLGACSSSTQKTEARKQERSRVQFQDSLSYIAIPCFLKKTTVVWKDSTMVSTPCRRPRFISQHLYGDSQPSIIPVPKYLTPSGLQEIVCM